MEDITLPQERQLSNRQMAALVALWKLSHYKQAPWSTWSILYSQPRPKRSGSSPMIWYGNGRIWRRLTGENDLVGNSLGTNRHFTVLFLLLSNSFDTKTYQLLRKQQDEELKAKQIHQHQIWQHVQDRLAEQNKALLEQAAAEEEEVGKTQEKKTKNSQKNKAGTNGTSGVAVAAKKRSIKWNLEKNITKSKCWFEDFQRTQASVSREQMLIFVSRIYI